MSRQMKYPEILDLNIGESLFIPRDEIGSVQTIRNIVSRLSRIHKLRLTVRDDYTSEHVEVTRIDEAPQSKAWIGPSSITAMTREQRKAAIAERLAQLNAQD